MMVRRIGISATIGAFAVLMAGCATTPPGSDLSRDDRWRADLAHLATELSKRHADAFFQVSREQFEARKTSIEAAIPARADHQLVCDLQSLAALIGDGHTGIRNAWEIGRFRSYPLQLQWLGDGYYIVATSRGKQAFLGARIEGVGDSSIGQACEKLLAFDDCENEASKREWISVALRTPEILHAAELIPENGGCAFSLRTSAGAIVTERFEPLPTDLQLRWIWASDYVPLSQQNRGSKYWFSLIAPKSAMYLCYNQCDGFAEFAAVSKRMWERFDASNAQRLIIDLRNNGGGNSRVLEPVFRGIAARRDRLGRPGAVVALIGPGTYSSAMMNAVHLRQRCDAVLIGQPTGGKPQSYGEIKYFELPCSKLRVSYSTRFFRLLDEDTPSVAPDVLVEPTMADFAASRDAVLERAFEYEPKSSRQDTSASQADAASGSESKRLPS